jgi:hypothetical protein
MRKITVVAVFALTLVSTWLVYSKVTQSRRETAYSAAIAPFQHDLHLGMARADVEQYLHSRGANFSWINFGQDAETYIIKIGEEPGSLVCEPWRVYIALEFSSSVQTTVVPARKELDPSDKLRDIHIKKLGTCL